MPFYHFIDDLSVDKYGKLFVKVVLSCYIWFNRKDDDYQHGGYNVLNRTRNI